MEEEVGSGDGSSIATVFGERTLHGAPLGTVVGKKVGQTAGKSLRRLGQMAATDEFEQTKISFFLTGDEVMDQHRATSGNGFVDGGSTRFTDDEVVAVKELRDAASPADKMDAARISVFDFPSTGVKRTNIPTKDDGKADVRRGIQQGAGVAAEEGKLGGGKVENAERIARI